jgi:hypothetical protein
MSEANIRSAEVFLILSEGTDAADANSAAAVDKSGAASAG